MYVSVFRSVWVSIYVYVCVRARACIKVYMYNLCIYVYGCIPVRVYICVRVSSCIRLRVVAIRI